jgi:hypothetical protein
LELERLAPVAEKRSAAELLDLDSAVPAVADLVALDLSLRIPA